MVRGIGVVRGGEAGKGGGEGDGESSQGFVPFAADAARRRRKKGAPETWRSGSSLVPPIFPLS